MTAKDLSDVVELLKNNRERLSVENFSGLHPQIRRELERIRRKIGDPDKR